MPRVIDLSYEMTHNMKAFPGDPSCEITVRNNYTNGYLVSRISVGTHVGTHVDAPVHKIPLARDLSQIPPEGYIGFKTYVADFTGLTGDVTPEMLDGLAGELAGCDAIILRTGWSKHAGTDEFFKNFPGISEGAVSWLDKAGIKLAGFETPSVNFTHHAEVHEAMLSRGIYPVESLCSPERITSKYVSFFAVPLKIKGADGFPVRAFAIELD